MPSQGYVRFPNIFQDRIVFVAEDDLWLVASEGGRAERLTAGVGEVKYPHFSPDGELLAFVGREEGPSEVYVMPALGGTAQRLTFQGGNCRVLGWSTDGTEILYSSNAGQFTGRFEAIYAVKPAGGEPRLLPFGMANAISYSSDGGIVIGRNINIREFLIGSATVEGRRVICGVIGRGMAILSACCSWMAMWLIHVGSEIVSTFSLITRG